MEYVSFDSVCPFTKTWCNNECAMYSHDDNFPCVLYRASSIELFSIVSDLASIHMALENIDMKGLKSVLNDIQDIKSTLKEIKILLGELSDESY